MIGFRTIRGRLTAWYVVSISVLVTTLGVGSWFAMRASLHELTALAARHGFEAFEAGVLERMRDGAGELAPQLEQAVPVDHVYLGLRRYLDKRAAA